MSATPELIAARKVKRAASKAAYRAANKDKIAAYHAAYRVANKDETAIHSAAYYAANKDKVSARHAAYRAANKDKIAAYHAAYRVANKDKVSARHAAYYAANKDKIAIHSAAYYAANKDKVSARHAAYWPAYYAANPEARRRAYYRRQASKLNNGYEIYTERQIVEMYGTDCHICNQPIDLNSERRTGRKGWEQALHIDHLVPISKGGADTLENVRPSHGLCNLSKGNRRWETK